MSIYRIFLKPRLIAFIIDKIQSFKKQKPEAKELLPWWVPPEKFKILSDLLSNKYLTALLKFTEQNLEESMDKVARSKKRNLGDEIYLKTFKPSSLNIFFFFLRLENCSKTCTNDKHKS